MWMTMMTVDGWMCSGHSRIEGGRQRGDEYKIFRSVRRLCVRPVFDIFASLLLLPFAYPTYTRLGSGYTREYIPGLHGHGPRRDGCLGYVSTQYS
jgi:hypothetical protein